MLKLVDKYLLREFLLIAGYCLLVFVALQILFDVFNHFSTLVVVKPGPGLLLRYYIGRVSVSFQYYLPASLLFSTLYTLWTMARHGELTAMRASGVALVRLMMPLLAVGLAGVAVVAFTNEFAVPTLGTWAREFSTNGFRMPTGRVAQNHAYYDVTGRRSWMIGRIDLHNPTVLENVRLTQEREDGTPEKRIYAERACWLDGSWWFFNARVQAYNEKGNPQGVETFLPSSTLGVEMRMLTEKPTDFVADLKDWDFLSTREMLRHISRRGNRERSSMVGEQVDLHMRLAMPWACFIVVLLGVPLGAMSSRQNAIKGILFVLLCFFAFYGLTQVCLFLGKRQSLPPWVAAWFSNLVFFMTGVVLLLRAR